MSKVKIYRGLSKSDKEKIERENVARYEALKEEKYASGEWKKPKSKE